MKHENPYAGFVSLHSICSISPRSLSLQSWGMIGLSCSLALEIVDQLNWAAGSNV